MILILKPFIVLSPRFFQAIRNNQKSISLYNLLLNKAEMGIILQYLLMDKRDLGKLLQCLDRIRKLKEIMN